MERRLEYILRQSIVQFLFFILTYFYNENHKFLVSFIHRLKSFDLDIRKYLCVVKTEQSTPKPRTCYSFMYSPDQGVSFSIDFILLIMQNNLTAICRDRLFLPRLQASIATASSLRMEASYVVKKCWLFFVFFFPNQNLPNYISN